MNENQTTDVENNLVERLVDETGCDRVLASMLLKFTGNDIDGAKRIIDAVPKDIFAIKAKFITQITGYYGALFFCYDEKEKKIKRVMAIIGDDKEIGKIDLSQEWQRFEEKLYQYAREKKVDAAKIEQLKKLVNSREFVERLSEIIKVNRTVNNEALSNMLLDELYNIFADTNIALKFEIDMTDAFALNKSLNDTDFILGDENKSGNEEGELENQKVKRKNQSLVVLKVDPVLSPVRGIPIKDLEFGDEIQVRITDERDIADYLATLLGGKVDSIRIPIYTKIIEVKELEGDNVGVIVQFGPGIMGMFKIPSDAKVVTRTVAEEEPESVVEKGKRDISPLIIIGGIFVVIVIFVLLIALT